MVKFAGTTGLRLSTTTSKYITSQLHAVNWTWLQLSLKLPFSHSRRASTAQHDDKISGARSLECVSKLEDRVLRDVNVPKPIYNLEIVGLFSNFPPTFPPPQPSRNGVSKASRRFSTQNPAINPAYHNDRGRNKYCRQTPPNGERHFGVDFDDIVYGDYVRDIMEIPASTRLFMGNRHVLSIPVHTLSRFLWYIGHVTVP